MKLYQIDEQGIAEASKMSLPSQIADRDLAVLAMEDKDDEDGIFPDDFLLVPRAMSPTMIEQVLIALQEKDITRISVSVAASAQSDTLNTDEIEAYLAERAPASSSTPRF